MFKQKMHREHEKKCTIFWGTNKTDIYVWNKVSEYKNLPKALYSGVHSVNSNVHLKLLCMKDNVAFKTPNVHTCSKSTKKCHYPPPPDKIIILQATLIMWTFSGSAHVLTVKQTELIRHLCCNHYGTNLTFIKNWPMDVVFCKIWIDE